MTDTPMFTKKMGEDLFPVLQQNLDDKVQELLKVSAEKFDHLLGVKGGGWSERFDAKMKRQQELMDELVPLARRLGTLKGRTVRFPMADSYALYLVTKVNAKTVRLQWLDYCDAWVDDRMGYGGNISASYVQSQINFDDAWTDRAEKRKLENLKAKA